MSDYSDPAGDRDPDVNYRQPPKTVREHLERMREDLNSRPKPATEATRAQAIRHALPLLEAIADEVDAPTDHRSPQEKRLRSVIADLRESL